MPPFIEPLASLVLGTEPRQRLRLLRTMTSGGVFAVCLLVQWHSVWAGYAAVGPSLLLGAFIVVGQLVFYVAIRGGYSLRMADPALTMPQMAFALTAVALAYRIDAHVRGILLMLVVLALVFGAFTLSPKRCRVLGWLAVGLFGAAMGWGALHEPERFDPGIELIHFFFVLTVLPTISFLSGQLSQTRIDLQGQKRELRSTMARLQMLATHDELTGLPNRRHVQEWMRRETARGLRKPRMLCLALIDLDHFKRVNDTLGHAVGDEVLRVFATEARTLLREGDMLARWGGEEFLLVMPDTSLEKAEVALLRLRERLAQPQAWASCAGARVTFSAGLAMQREAQALELLVQLADEALYKAKAAGRDRVVRARTEVETA
jgi:diguanylate cyclase (GGDEF)-like protein